MDVPPPLTRTLVGSPSVMVTVNAVAAHDDGAGIAGGGPYDSPPGGAAGGAVRGWEMGTFKLKCTPAMRITKHSAAATMAIVPL